MIMFSDVNLETGLNSDANKDRPMSLSESMDRLHESVVRGSFVTSQSTQPKSGEKLNTSLFSLREGKWSYEEEVLTKKLISSFNSGFLQLPVGTTLLSYLSDRLFWYVLLHTCDFYILFCGLSTLGLIYSY